MHKSIIWAIAGTALLSGGWTADAKTYSAQEMAAESAKANAFFEKAFQEELQRHPEVQTQLGLKENYDKWDDESEAAQAEDLALALRHLAELRRSINFDALDPQAKVSFRLWVRRTEHAAEGFQWRFHTYPVNQM